MTEPNPVDPRVNRLGEMVLRGYEEAKVILRPRDQLGCTLFTGQSYALPAGILMLGLNPGISSSTEANVTLQSENRLLTGTPLKRLPYWTNAKYLFGRDSLRVSMTSATFSFCCPFRTRDWVNLPQATRQALTTASQPVLQRMMDDCSPRLVIIAGVATESLFREMLKPNLVELEGLSRGPYVKGTYRWRATLCTWHGQPLTLAQIPHLSRANSKLKLDECAEWLSGLLPDPAN